jgi:hypothetical protein
MSAGDAVGTAGAPGPDAVFQELFDAVMAHSERFGHRQHVEVAWLAVRRLGPEPAARVVADGIITLATAAGRPEKYDAELTRAWMGVVAAAVAQDPEIGIFEDFAAKHPDLLEPGSVRSAGRP